LNAKTVFLTADKNRVGVVVLLWLKKEAMVIKIILLFVLLLERLVKHNLS
jgi:hypothetical protein